MASGQSITLPYGEAHKLKYTASYTFMQRLLNFEYFLNRPAIAVDEEIVCRSEEIAAALL